MPCTPPPGPARLHPRGEEITTPAGAVRGTSLRDLPRVLPGRYGTDPPRRRYPMPELRCRKRPLLRSHSWISSSESTMF